MDPDRYARLREAFHRLADGSADERAAGLEAFARAEADDPALVAELRALLDHAEDATDVDLGPAAAEAMAALEDSGTGGGGAGGHRDGDDAADDERGTNDEHGEDDEGPGGVRIPGYRIRRLIGAGGMGVVYEAEQLSPRRAVAIKLLRAPDATPSQVRRFEREAEALGRLDHPHVARIHEAGRARTRGGTEPFIAMELVRGIPIDRYVREHALGDEAIVRLLAAVCAGVEASHAVGIVHRDLKPGNVLVDEAGVPRILDFGVARLAGATHAGTLTAPGGLVGTPAYLAPERFEPGAGPPGPATDVYALGVMAFELLAGRRPRELDGLPLAEVARLARDESATRLTSVDGRFRGDLDVIVSTAMAADPARRYPSARGLREDLERHLGHEPIRARPPSAAYRARKFVRRHRTLTAATAAVVTVLAASTVGLALALAETERARAAAVASERDAVAAKEEADRQSERQAAMLQFFARDLLQSGDDRPLDAELTLVAALESAEPRIETRFTDDPEAAGVLYRTFALLYADLGVIEKSLAARERGAELTGARWGRDHGFSGIALLQHAQGLGDADRWDEAERVAREAHRVITERAADPETAAPPQFEIFARVVWADTLQVLGRHDEARPLLREAIELARDREMRPAELYAMNILAASLLATEDFAEALEVLEAEVAAAREIHPPGHPQTMSALGNLARARMALGDLDGAETAVRESLAMQRETLPGSHWRIGFTLTTLAGVLGDRGRPAEAAAAAEEAATILAAVHGPDHHRTVDAWTGMVGYRLEAGALDAARAAVEAVPETFAAAAVPVPEAMLETCLEVVSALTDAGRADAAAALRERVRPLVERAAAADAAVRERLPGSD